MELPEYTPEQRAAIKMDDLRRVAHHEAGHFTVARHFGTALGIKIIPTPGGPSFGKHAYSGQTSHLTATPFRKAVISWAGPMAEEFVKVEPELTGGSSIDDLWNWFSEIMYFDIEDMSDTDRVGVLGHPQHWRACKTAFNILNRRRDDFLSTAKHEIEWTLCLENDDNNVAA